MRINKIYSAFAAAAVLMGAAACTDKVDYQPTPAYTGQNVYFSSELGDELRIATDATSFTVPIYRQGDTSELTVGLEATIVDDEGQPTAGIFTVPTQVTFPEGATDVEIPFGVELAQITPEMRYVLNIKIAGEDKTPYGLTDMTYTVLYSPWTALEKYDEDGMPALVTISVLSDYVDRPLPVYVSHSLANMSLPEDKRAMRFQFGDYDCIDLQPVEDAQEDWCNGYNAVIDYDPVTGFLTMEPTPTNIDYGGKEIYCTDVYTYVTKVNPAAAGDTDPSRFQGLSQYLVDRGLIGLNAIWYTESGILQQEYDYYQLPGFKSYTLRAEYTGTRTTVKGDEYALVEVYRSDDVASFAYELQRGALTTEQASALADKIEANTDAELYYDQTTTFEFQLRQPGTFTMVLVGYDEDGQRVAASKYEFDYKPAIPYNWNSVGVAEYTDGFMYCMYNGLDAMTWDVEVEQSSDNPGIIRMVNPYKSANYPYTSPSQDLPGNAFITLNIEDPAGVYVLPSPQNIQWSSQDGEISFSSQAGNNIVENGMTLASQKRKGLCGTLDADDVITFPGGALTISFSKVQDGVWHLTNFDMNLPHDSSKPADMAAQLKSTGEFYLDLSSLKLAGKSAPAKAKAALPIVGRVVKRDLRSAAPGAINVAAPAASSVEL